MSETSGHFLPSINETTTVPPANIHIKKLNSIQQPDDIENIKESKIELLISFLHRKDVKWGNVLLLTVLHIFGVYSTLTFPYIQRWKTTLWRVVVELFCGLGVTGAAHRYWCHRSFKANTPLKIILTICFLMSGQNSIYQWVRDHRVHHKYTETDADPHNSRRGFFFAHVGWLMLQKHPNVIRRGKQIDMSDIEADPIASFVNRYFPILRLMIAFVIPITVPIIFWNETWYYATMAQISRYIHALNYTWSVNSFAHFYGNRPYDKNMAPAENKFVSIVALGEGWHNYHHVFPSDYRTAEIGGSRVNWTKNFIDFFATLGWAYDRQVTSDSLIKMTVVNRGDGTHEYYKKAE